MKRLLCCCIVVSVFCVPVIASPNIEKIKQAYQLGDFKSAFPELRNLSSLGEPEADYLLGKMYERGHGIEQDESRAIQYYRNAASGGFAEAKERLELLTGTENSVVLDWYLEAAWDGDPISQFNLGFIYESGMGVRIDEARAVQWYREASEQNYGDAQLRLGMMHITGAGVEQDVSLGEALIKTAAFNDQKIAQEINNLLFLENESLDAIQIIRGLRTIEDNSPDTLITALKNSVEILRQDVAEKVVVNELASNTHLNPPVRDEIVNVSMATAQDDVAEISLLANGENAEQSARLTPVVPVVAQSETGNVVTYWVLFSVLVLGLGAYMARRVSRNKTQDDGFLPTLKLSDQIKVPELHVDTEDMKFLRELWQEDDKSKTDIHVSLAGEKVVAKTAERASQESAIQTASKPETSVKVEKTPAVIVDQTPVVKESGKNDASNGNVSREMESTKKDIANSKQAVTKNNIAETKAKAEDVEIPQISSHALSQFRVDKAAIMKTVRNKLDPFMEKLMFQSLLPQQLEDLTFTARTLPSENSDQVLIADKTDVETIKSDMKPLNDAAFSINEIATGDNKPELSSSHYALEQVKEIQASEGQDPNALAETRFNIGLMFAKGDGTPRNVKLAIKWLQKAADLGHPQANEELSNMLAKYPEYASMAQLVTHDELSLVKQISIKKVS